MDDKLSAEEADLQAALAGVRAPASMRRYQSMPPRPLPGGGNSPRTRGLIAVLVVALVGTVTGTYFGLRGTPAHSGSGSASSPSARYLTAMAFDADRGRVVLFSGIDGTPTPLDDTWLWDGSSWTLAHPAHSPPAAPGVAAMAWDPKSHRVILVTGCGKSTDAAQVCAGSSIWAWDGRDWSRLPQADGPMTPLAMATDERDGRLIAVSADFAIGSGRAAGGAGVALPAATPASSGASSGQNGSRIACPLTDGASVSGLPPLGGPCGGCPAMKAAEVCTPCPAVNSSACRRPLPAVPVFGTVTWAFDGGRFQRLTSSQVPVLGGQLVWSPSRGRLLDVVDSISPKMAQPAYACLQGSVCPPQSQDAVWEWQSDHWQVVQPAGSVSVRPRFGAHIVTDGRHGDVVAIDSGQTLTGTGVDGQWSRQSPGTSPPARNAAAGAAFDSARGVVVIFGGEALPAANGPAGALNDTWTWDGSTWTLRAGSTRPSPPPGGFVKPPVCVTSLPESAASPAPTPTPGYPVPTQETPSPGSPVATPLPASPVPTPSVGMCAILITPQAVGTPAGGSQGAPTTPGVAP